MTNFGQNCTVHRPFAKIKGDTPFLDLHTQNTYISAAAVRTAAETAATAAAAALKMT